MKSQRWKRYLAVVIFLWLADAEAQTNGIAQESYHPKNSPVGSMFGICNFCLMHFLGAYLRCILLGPFNCLIDILYSIYKNTYEFMLRFIVVACV